LLVRKTSGEASELGNDEVCVLSSFADNTDAMGLDDTKALFTFVGAEYPFLELKIILLEDVKSDNIGKVITTYHLHS
jgi:hypothetical protein